MTKNKGGRGAKSVDSRRNSPRIAIAPSFVEKLDAIAKTQGKSRADVLEELIEKRLQEIMIIINLTPHPILIPGYLPINPSGVIARAIEEVEQAPKIGDYPCTYQRMGRVENLPDFEEGKFYIVSLPIWDLLSDREDLLLAGQQLRDDSGKIIGCKSLVRRRPKLVNIPCSQSQVACF